MPIKTFALAPVVLLVLTGCAITPKPFSQEDISGRVAQDNEAIYKNQEAPSKPIDFNEALARSLKYNLDYRLKLMESAVARGLADVSRYDMMPSLLASAGYTRRNNDAGTTSYNSITGLDIPGDPTSSQERERRTAGIEFSWNVLDFGLSYYRANQQADQVLIAEERRRRVTQMIAQDVRSAYWRAVGAQRLQEQTEQLIERTRTGLERSRRAEREGVMPPSAALNYQRQMLDALDVLANRRQELNYAKRELAALMNVPPGTEFELVADVEPALVSVPANVTQLEEMALLQRSELREQDYEKRITENERRRQILALLPNLNFTVAAQHDSNRFLFNNQWADSGAQLSVNLLRLLAIPSINKTQDAQVALSDARRRALAMAIITQVRVAVERYNMAVQDLQVARESSAVDQRLLNFSQANQVARTESELDLVRAEVRALNSDYQRYLAYATAQTAFGRMFNTLGVNVLPDNLQGLSLPELTQRLDGFLTTTLNETFPPLPDAPVHELPRVSVNVEFPAGTPNAAAAQASVRQALARNQVLLDEAGKPAGAALSMRVDMAPAASGPRRVTAVMRMVDAKGTEVGTSTYASTLPNQANPRALTAFAEAAAVANLASISGWLHKMTP